MAKQRIEVTHTNWSMKVPGSWDSTTWKFSPNGEYVAVAKFVHRENLTHQGQLTRDEQEELFEFIKELEKWHSQMSEESQWVCDGDVWSLSARIADSIIKFKDLYLFDFSGYKDFTRFFDKIDCQMPDEFSK